MRRVGRKLVSVLLALAMVVLCLPEYVKPVNKAVAAEATKTVYVRSNTLAADGEYLIVSSATPGEATMALSHSGTTATATEISTVHAAADGIKDVYINPTDVDNASVWKAVIVDGYMRLVNEVKTETNTETYYLQVYGSYGSSTLSVTNSPNAVNGYSHFNWLYNEDPGYLYITYDSNHESRRYLHYENGGFSGTNNPNDANVFIFVKTEVHEHSYKYDDMVFTSEWSLGKLHVEAYATYSCTTCDQDPIRVNATTELTSVSEGSCLEAPTWTYTGTVSADDSPIHESKSVEYTVTQRVPDYNNTTPGKVFVLTDTISPGDKILIVSSNALDEGHALSNGYPATNSNGYAVSDSVVTIESGDLMIDGVTSTKKYIKSINETAAWTVSAGNSNTTYNLKNGDYTLYHTSGNENAIIYLGTQGQPGWRSWTVSGNNLVYVGGRHTYYVKYDTTRENVWEHFPRETNNDWNTLSATARVYFFKETDISMPGFTVLTASGHPNLVKTDAKPAGCETDGNIDYWYCETCGNYYNNADGAAEHKISLADTVIPAAHDWEFDHFEWAGNKIDGWTGAQAVYKCTKTEGQTHTNDEQPVTFTTKEYRTEKGDNENKNVYKVEISEADALDGIPQEADETIYLYYVAFEDDEGNPIPNAGKLYSKDTEPANIVTPAITKAEDQGHTYAFDGWTPEIVKVTADATYKAVFSTETKAFTITFVNADGEELQKTEVDYGTMPVYEGATPTITPTVDKVFTFTGWDPELTEVTGEQEYTAQYSEKPREYTVSFTVEGNTTQGPVKYGDSPTYDGTPVKPSTDDRFRYEFVGWNNGTETFVPGDDLPEVEGNQSYTAVFVTKYHVTIETINGEVKIVDSGDAYFAAGEVISLTKTTEDGYVYVPGSIKVTKGEESVAVTENEDGTTFTMPEGAVTVTAKFIRAYEIYIGDVQVTEENLDDVLGDGSVSCAYDDTENKEMWTITFTEAPALTNDDCPAIIWFLESAPLKVVAPKEGLALESNSAFVGIFCPEYGLIIEGDLTITLNGKPSPYSDFPGLHGIGAASLEVNGNLTIVIDPDETGEDAGAYPEDFGGIHAEDEIAFGSKMSTVDITVPEGGIAISTDSEGDITIPETHGIKLPEDGKVDAFVYDSSIGDVAPKIVTIVDADGAIANIVAIRKICKVEFKNGEEVLAEDDYLVGDTPEIILEKEPEKEKDKQYTYEFAGWEDQDGNKYPKTGDLPELTGDTTFTAYFEGTLNKYTVTFVDEDGKTELSKETYEYGTKAADIKKPANPMKESTAGKTYGFGGWTPEIADVTGDATYTATYVDADAKYTVTFVDEDGKELKAATEYTYGTKAADIAKPADPTKTEDEKYTYEFSGWSPEISDVINNATYKATYKAVEKKQEEEKGVYQYVGPAELTYTKGSGKGFVFTFKRTKNDELTKERFRKFLRNNADIDAKWLKITYGSVIIEVSSEYLDSLPEGRNEFTATFEDGDPVSVALTILPAQSSEEQTSPDSPKTADTMFVLWLALILGIATVTVAVMIKKREKDEEIGL